MDWTEEQGYFSVRDEFDVELADAFPDDPEGIADVERQFAEYGNASVGGGAAPMFILRPSKGAPC
jgi:hypothetical protein